MTVRTRFMATLVVALCAGVLTSAAPMSASAPPTDPTAEMAAIGVISPPAPVGDCVALTRSLHPGDTDGDAGDVSCLQAQLVAAQIPLVEVSGVFDEPTRLAVATWQTLNGLTVDGWVGAQTAPTLGFSWDPPAPPVPAPSAEPDNGSDNEPTDASADTPTDPESCLAEVRAGASAVANAIGGMPLASIRPGDLPGTTVGRFWGLSDLSAGEITIDCTATPLGGWFGIGAHEQAHWIVLAATGKTPECATDSVAYLLVGAGSGFYERCDSAGQEAIELFRHYWGSS